MIDPKTPVQNTLLLYMIIILILLFVKPRLLFNEHGKLKSFGCGENKTLFNLPVVVISSGIMLYFLFTTLDMIN